MESSFAFLVIISCFLVKPMAALPEPDFVSRFDNVTTVAGRDARLPCIVENLQDYKIAWVHYGSSGSAVLTVGTHVLTTNRRVSVAVERNSWTLVIANSTVEDRGEYMCQISTVPAKKMLGRLYVQVHPHISHPPSDVTADEGDNVTLQCQASGDPPPRITWRREDGNSLFGNGTTELMGETLILPGVRRANAGPHLCVASNGVPPAVSARVQIFINYPPMTLQNESGLVWAAVGDRATLECHFWAYPKPNVTWTMVDKVSKPGNLVVHTQYSRHDRGTSIIYLGEVKKEQFGTYKCAIQNQKGLAHLSVTLMEKITTTSTTTTTTSTTASTLAPTTTEIVSIPSLKFKNISSDNTLTKFFENLLSRTGGAAGDDSSDEKSRDLVVGTSGLNNVATKEEGETNPPNRFIQESPHSKGASFSYEYTSGADWLNHWEVVRKTLLTILLAIGHQSTY